MRSILALCFTSTVVTAATVRTSTPLMGWNSYNYYNCYPNETIIKTNAAGLVELGFHEAGYTFVTPDCGWSSTFRDSAGHLVWNASLFPSGGAALGEYIHGLGLNFGMYSGAGHFQCGSTDQPASLGESTLLHSLRVCPHCHGSWLINLFNEGYETIDAESFAGWGADALKSVHLSITPITHA